MQLQHHQKVQRQQHHLIRHIQVNQIIITFIALCPKQPAHLHRHTLANLILRLKIIMLRRVRALLLLIHITRMVLIIILILQRQIITHQVIHRLIQVVMYLKIFIGYNIQRLTPS